MKVIIAGSRDISNTPIETYLAIANWNATEVVSGGATGVDRDGEIWANRNKIPIKFFYPMWNSHGKAAGPIRNKEMAAYADALLLIWDGKSRGSASMKREAELAGLKIHEVVL